MAAGVTSRPMSHMFGVSNEERPMSRFLTRDIGDTLWVGLVAVSSVLFSLALACATPFAAIATIAGTRMPAGRALALTIGAWFANQLVGYLVLGYPTTWDSFAWGAVIGIAALAAVVAVLAVRMSLTSGGASVAVSLVAAFVAYELVLFAATAVLPSGNKAFSLSVVVDIFSTNVLAFAGLLIMHRLAVSTGLLATTPCDHEPRYA